MGRAPEQHERGREGGGAGERRDAVDQQLRHGKEEHHDHVDEHGRREHDGGEGALGVQLLDNGDGRRGRARDRDRREEERHREHRAELERRHERDKVLADNHRETKSEAIGHRDAEEGDPQRGREVRLNVLHVQLAARSQANVPKCLRRSGRRNVTNISEYALSRALRSVTMRTT
eukprot:6172875-Pleurochrysis_carterae.AAC.5